MAAAAILKIGLMAISRSLWHIFARNFEIHFNGHSSATTTHICTKFGTETKNNIRKTELTSYFTSEKIQDGGGRHFENWFKGYISVTMTYICMKFYTGTETILHKPFCCQNSIPAKSKMAAAANLKFTLMATTRLFVNIFAQK